MSWGGVSLRGYIGWGKGKAGECSGGGRLAELEGLLTYTIRVTHKRRVWWSC